MIIRKLNFIVVFSLICCFISSSFAGNHWFLASTPCKSEAGLQSKLQVSSGYKIEKIVNDKVDIHIGGGISTFSLSCGSVKTLAPFFVDKVDRNNKLLQLKPALNDFDKRILQTCGDWDKDVNDDFLDLIGEDVLNPLYDALGRRIFNSDDDDPEDFFDEFGAVWTTHNAFKNIFCGALTGVGKDEYNGPTYVGRYLDLQSKGYIGLNSTCESNSVNFPVYRVGVDFVTRDGMVKTRCMNAYVYDLGAMDILIYATKLYKFNNNRSCYYNINRNGNTYQMFFSGASDPGNTDSRGIIAFYPDSTAHLRVPRCSMEK